MEENRRTTYRISEAARDLGISAEWLRVGERRGFFPPALRDRNGHRFYTEEDIERMRKGRGELRREPARGSRATPGDPAGNTSEVSAPRKAASS